jgi:imidazolonepropionase-like amidohydrolase
MKPILALVCCAVLLPTIGAAQERIVMIRGAHIVPVVGNEIPNGDVIIRGDLIESVGTGLTAPPGATVINGQGLRLYPGLINSGTTLGLEEIGSVPGGTDTRELGNYNPHNLSLTAVNPHSELIPVTRVNGITTAVTGAGGGVVSGVMTLIDLTGWTADEMAEVAHLAMRINYPRLPGGRFGRRGGGPANPDAVNRQVGELKEYLGRARTYDETRDRMEAAGETAPSMDIEMEAMRPVVDGRMPVLFEVTTAAQIRGALAIADSFGLKTILAGANEAWILADSLAQLGIPVVLGPLTSTPGDDDPYDMIYANPGVLAKAGVRVAFRSNDAAESRNLPYNAALAVAYGMDAQDALRALTINPATIWGVGDRLGSIEPGKVANLQLTTGDPLDVRTEVRQVFIRGVPIPMTDRHTELYEKFRTRPKP